MLQRIASLECHRGAAPIVIGAAFAEAMSAKHKNNESDEARPRPQHSQQHQEQQQQQPHSPPPSSGHQWNANAAEYMPVKHEVAREPTPPPGLLLERSPARSSQQFGGDTLEDATPELDPFNDLTAHESEISQEAAHTPLPTSGSDQVLLLEHILEHGCIVDGMQLTPEMIQHMVQSAQEGARASTDIVLDILAPTQAAPSTSVEEPHSEATPNIDATTAHVSPTYGPSLEGTSTAMPVQQLSIHGAPKQNAELAWELHWILCKYCGTLSLERIPILYKRQWLKRISIPEDRPLLEYITQFPFIFDSDQRERLADTSLNLDAGSDWYITTMCSKKITMDEFIVKFANKLGMTRSKPKAKPET